jgi:GGDEF domain-containing protein
MKMRLVRASDVLARFGGDEFVALIETPSREAAGIAAGKMLDALTSPATACRFRVAPHFPGSMMMIPGASTAAVIGSMKAGFVASSPTELERIRRRSSALITARLQLDGQRPASRERGNPT